ncbi:MAG: hypothetical protein Q9217_002286, partial [Psora testacea]
TIFKTGVLGKPIAGEAASDPIEVDSADDCSSDDSGSDTGREPFSAMTPTCVSSSDEYKKKDTVTGGKGAEGPVTVAPTLQDSGWRLDIDQFPDNYVGFEDRAAEGKHQKTGDIEDNIRSDGAKGSEAEGGPQEMSYNVNPAENGPEDDEDDDDVDRVEHNGGDAITVPEMDGIEVYGDRSHSKSSPRVGFSGNAKVPGE